MNWDKWLNAIFGREKKSDVQIPDDIPEGFEEFFKGPDAPGNRAPKPPSFEQDHMLRQFDEMFKEMDKEFRQMGIHDFSEKEFSKRGDWHFQNRHWQDMIEKHQAAIKDGQRRRPAIKEDQEITELPDTPTLFKTPPSPTVPNRSPDLDTDGYKVDIDLDSELQRALGKGDYSQLAPIKPEPKQERPRPGWLWRARPFGPGFEAMPGNNGQGSSSVSVYTYRSSSDGSGQRVEERKTVEYSPGNRETTVTRRIGDQSQTITTKHKPDGSEELVETTVNLEKDEKENFLSRWNQTALPGGSSSEDGKQGSVVPKQPTDVDMQKKSIFYNLFGSTFPGFPSSKKDDDD